MKNLDAMLDIQPNQPQTFKKFQSTTMVQDWKLKKQIIQLSCKIVLKFTRLLLVAGHQTDILSSDVRFSAGTDSNRLIQAVGPAVPDSSDSLYSIFRQSLQSLQCFSAVLPGIVWKSSSHFVTDEHIGGMSEWK